jgi:dipeptidyl-peptidase-4
MKFQIKNFFFILLAFVILGPVSAQQKLKITTEDIWQKNTFQVKSVHGVNWMKDGRYYSTEVADNANQAIDIVRVDVTTGQPVNTIIEGESLRPDGSNGPLEFDSYEFSADEKKVLFSANIEPIYRRSSKADFYVYDLASKKLSKLSPGGKQSYASYSPDGKQVAFVRDNNLFVVDLASMQEKQLTTDGKFNQIINGAADWVYEEEFEFAQAFFWSPASDKIAFYSFNESQVPEYNMQIWGDLYPKDYRFKYPKAGEPNSVVSVSVYDLKKGQAVKMNVGSETNQYIPRVTWTTDNNLLSIRRMNRLQNTLEILHANALTGESKVVLTEKDKAYVEITDDLKYLKNGKQFVMSSEKDGFRHLYLYGMDGHQIRQITKGDWEIDEVLGVDEKNDMVYFTSTEVSPMTRQLYRISLKGKNKTRLTQENGTHKINMSPDFQYYLDYFSTANTPQMVSLHTAKDGKQIKALEDNAALKKTLAQYETSPLQFFNFKTSENVSLNGWMIKPTNFDATKKYPVLMFVYGGPGNQQVNDTWNAKDFMWYQMLAEKGYMIVCVDNRGTGGRGAEFKKSTYANLGKFESQDQIETAKYLAALPNVDPGRIGIWGWSFGGYMTLLALTKGADYFKAGIAVAPVTNWRFYDSIYTERFLKTPQENAAGYDDNSPVNYADKLKAKLLLVHGTGDDNVHVQNSMAMTEALIKNNKPFESFYYPNRNHGIYGGNTRLHLYNMMTSFIERNL